MEDSVPIISIIEAELISNPDELINTDYYTIKYGHHVYAILRAVKCNCSSECICKNCMIISTVDFDTDKKTFQIKSDKVIGLGTIISSMKNVI